MGTFTKKGRSAEERTKSSLFPFLCGQSGTISAALRVSWEGFCAVIEGRRGEKWKRAFPERAEKREKMEILTAGRCENSPVRRKTQGILFVKQLRSESTVFL